MKRKYDYIKRKNQTLRRIIIFSLSAVLVFSFSFDGTIAWLMDITEPVENTFTYGKINIKLDETDTEIDEDNDDRTNDYEIVLGTHITKDPKVTVEKGSEDCWLFVELNESENFDEYLAYNILVRDNDEWIPLIGHEGIYYREVNEDDVKDSSLVFEIIENNKLTVLENVTKDDLHKLDEDTYPRLEITAYAVQKTSIETAEDAWELIENNPQ